MARLSYKGIELYFCVYVFRMVLYEYGKCKKSAGNQGKYRSYPEG